jgi:hypothetical protein
MLQMANRHLASGARSQFPGLLYSLLESVETNRLSWIIGRAPVVQAFKIQGELDLIAIHLEHAGSHQCSFDRDIA